MAIFHIRVNPSVESIRQVAVDIGCERATDIDTLNEIFRGKFIEGMKAVAIQTSNEDLLQNRTIFKEEIIKMAVSCLIIRKSLNPVSENFYFHRK